MPDCLPPNDGYDHNALGPRYLGQTPDGRHDATTGRAKPTFERLDDVPEIDDFIVIGEPEKAWAFYLMALWQLVTWQDLAESWARPNPSRRPNFLRAVDPQA